MNIIFFKIYDLNIDFHSKCNRQCEWCPNKFYPTERLHNDVILDETVFQNFIQDLYNNNFAMHGATIKFLGYNEPLLQFDILCKYINIICDIFRTKKLTFVINTNGDKIAKKHIDYFSSLKTRNKKFILNIQDYDNLGAEYWENKLNTLNLNNLTYEHNNAINIKVSDNFQVNTKLNWPLTHELEDRGGLLKPELMSKDLLWKNNHKIREKKCGNINSSIQLFYNGDISFCCHFNPLAPEHKDYILGNIYKDSICNIWNSEKRLKLMQTYIETDPKDYPQACQYCSKISHPIQENMFSQLYKYLIKNVEELNKYFVMKEICCQDLHIDNIEGKTCSWDHQSLSNDYIKSALEDKTKIAKDILKNGMYFPVVVYYSDKHQKYIVAEGRHRVLSFLEYDKNYKILCLIIPKEFIFRKNTDTNKSSLQLPKKIKLFYPPDYINKQSFYSHIDKDFTVLENEWKVLESQDAWDLYDYFRRVTSVLSKQLYNFPDIKPYYK